MYTKDIKSVKEIVDWLNEELSTGDKNLFLAYYDKNDSLKMWHIACSDYWTYISDEAKASVEAVREAYPDLRFVFCSLNFLGDWVMKKKKETQQGKPVIIVR